MCFQTVQDNINLNQDLDKKILGFNKDLCRLLFNQLKCVHFLRKPRRIYQDHKFQGSYQVLFRIISKNCSSSCSDFFLNSVCRILLRFTVNPMQDPDKKHREDFVKISLGLSQDLF